LPRVNGPDVGPVHDDNYRVLAPHKGFTGEELDFIINYDIKYRMGRDTQEPRLVVTAYVTRRIPEGDVEWKRS